MATQPTYHAALETNLPHVRERIAAAAERSGRDPDTVRVVAVTKGHAPGAIEAALAAGLRDIGENRVEELQRKVPLFQAGTVTWHAIGHIQRRKAAGAARLAALIHSVDSVRLAEKLSRLGEAQARRVPVLIQVNASGEAAKGGLPAALDPEAALDGIGAIAALPGLRVMGLMTMAPLVADEATLRATFARTHATLEAASSIDGLAGRELSMGMSNDYQIAVEEGSTMVRLGTTLFGPRPA